MRQRQRKAAKAASGCLVLLLLYGCASFLPGNGQEADGGRAAEELSWGAGLPGRQEDVEAPGRQEGVSAADAQASGRQEGVPAADAADGTSERGTDTSQRAATGGGFAGEDASGTVTVYVCGAVERPGVYTLSAGSRVYEAVALAGGMTQEASAWAVNQAKPLTDGQMIVLLTQEEAGALSGEEKAPEDAGDKRVNINTAGAQELKALPGIGDAKAAAIIAYREENGAFSAASDLKKVEGIGEKVYARLEGLITVD